MRRRQYIKDVLFLGSFVLPLALLNVAAVHYVNEHPDRLVDDLTSPMGLAYLVGFTAYTLLRPLRRPVRSVPTLSETFRKAAERRR
jgi:hypothetical protein